MALSQDIVTCFKKSREPVGYSRENRWNILGYEFGVSRGYAWLYRELSIYSDLNGKTPKC